MWDTMSLNRLIAAAIASTVLCACAVQPVATPPVRLPTVAMTPEIADAAETSVKGELRDPTSAQFSGLTALQDEGSIDVCGFVNARNGFGGYTGAVPFRAAVAVTTGPNGVHHYDGLGAVISEPTDQGIHNFYIIVWQCAP